MTDCPFCTTCGGTGIVKTIHIRAGVTIVLAESCPKCKGSGYVR